MSHSSDYTIQGIQHMGIAVSDMDASLKLYRKLFGLDIPFFDAVAAAPLMDSHCNGETIVKRASMVMNMQGGCAVEVVSPTSSSLAHACSSRRSAIWGLDARSSKPGTCAPCMPTPAPWWVQVRRLPQQDPTGWTRSTSGIWTTTSFKSSLRPLVLQLRAPFWRRHGGVVGVTDMEASFKLYKDILKYDKVLLDETGTFEDWAGLPGETKPTAA